MADDADSIMRAWRTLLHGRPDTGRYADHMMRIYNPAGDRSTALRIMKDLLMEGYWHGGSPKEADFDTKPAWYDGLDDGRTLSIICGISSSPDSLKRDRSLPYDRKKAERIIIHDDDGPLPVGFDDAFAFLPYNYCTQAGVYVVGPYTPGMFGTAPFDETRAYGLPFAKAELIREMSGQ